MIKKTTVILLSIFAGYSHAQCDYNVIFANTTTNAFCFDTTANTRKVYTNDIPNHTYGPFGGNNSLVPQQFEYSMCRYPELGTETVYLIQDLSLTGCSGGIIFGVSQIGINYSPFARLYFTNTQTQAENLAFEEEAVNILNMDLNGGHVNTLGRYHYHEAPMDYFVNDLNIDGSSHSPILGYAADGFPIYYKYLYDNANDNSSQITAFSSSYQMKTGARPGDGIAEPDGTYDGTYYQDYEYDAQLSELDECGGRFGVTPDYPNGTYYYVLTDNWPHIPRCLKGKYIDNSFRLGPNCANSTAAQDCSIEIATGISKVESNLSLNIFPNPASRFIQLTLTESAEDKISSIKLYDITGKIVYHKYSFESKIEVGNLTKGTYFLQINVDDEQITKKVVLK
tara:strand:- start:1426 stop:2613 length:1188 start_codon:yes stop_codon:yes gene_type:complete